MPTSVLNRVSMTSSKTKRTWSRFSRSSSSTPSPTSPKQSSFTPPSPQPSHLKAPSIHPEPMPSQTPQHHSPEQSKQPQAPQQRSNPTSPNQSLTHNPQAFLRQIKSLLGDFEQIHNVNQTPLSDSRIRHIRHQVEKNMPLLYSLQQQMKNHPSSEASLIVVLAENFLKRFPDVDDAFLRSLQPATQSKLPEASNHPQAPRFPSFYSVSSHSSKPPLHANPPVAKTNMTPATTSTMSHPSNYQYFSPASSHPRDSYASRPPCVPSALADHRPALTGAQEMLLRSVYSLSSNYRQSSGSASYEAPAALSPMEIENMSVAINRRMALTPIPSGAGAFNSSGFGYGHAQYAARQDMRGARYSSWVGANSTGGRYGSYPRADMPRSSSDSIRHRRSNSDER
ncbi:unnamed protein product [Agarophyton chilense]